MSYLFGDLSPAPFVTNFLEELRDALDFAGGIADADQTIGTADERRARARTQAEAELARLEALAWTMIAAAQGSDLGAADSASARLAAELGMLVNERRDLADAAVRTKLEEEIVALDADVVAAREDYFPTLQDWLLVREPPKTEQTRHLELVAGTKKDQHRYRASLTGKSAIGLAWSIELVADGGVLAGPLRVSRLASDLAIITPQVTGLIKKEIKSKKQRLDRSWITEVIDDGETITIELRAEVGEPEGFSVSVAPGAVALERRGRAEDPTVGTFAVAAEDEPALRDLAARLREVVSALPKQRLVSASFDGLSFDGTNAESQPQLVQVVVRLVESLAPAVDEIASRSRSDAELVLRRELADGRREELFMPKARLREKFAALDAERQKLFTAVARALSQVPSDAGVKTAVPSSMRSEVAQPEPPYVKRRSSGAMNAVVAPLRQETDDAFRRFKTQFGSTAFAAMSPSEQRAALKTLFFEQPTSVTEEAKSAYRATLPILQTLILKEREPADYELLGMAYVALEELEKATEIFKKGIEAERTRDPSSSSELYERLILRVSGSAPPRPSP